MNEWIEEKTQKPPECKDDLGYSIQVLITDGQDVTTGYFEYEYFAESPWEALQYSSECWHADGFLRTDCCGWPKVTHWMYLPELPKDNNE